jgi:hypothetical protein
MDSLGRGGWAGMRMAIRSVLFLCVLLGTGLEARPAQAYAWMIRHGFAECGDCHVDPMGGETLTGMGRVTSETLLSSAWSEAQPSKVAELLFGAVTEPDAVRLGGSFRGMSIANFETGRVSAFPMQADLYGAGYAGKLSLGLSLGVSRASRRYEHASKARLVGNVEDEGLLLVSRNHWIAYDLTQQLKLRAGRLNLPFGIRTPEHTLWVRSETLTDRESDQQHGISLVYTGGPVRAELLASLGNFQIAPDAIRERGYSGYLEYLLEPRLALGVSSLVLVAQRERTVDEGVVSRQAHGLTARYAPWTPLVVLLEADAIKHTGAAFGYVGMATFDLEALRGLHFALIGELLNRGKPGAGASPGDGETRFGSWLTVNWFFGPHFDLRTDLVIRQNRAEMLQTQLHFYL